MTPTEPAVGRELLRADLRWLPAPRRARGRPARTEAALPRRHRHLHRRLAPERPRELVGVPDPRPRPAGARRSPRLACRPLDRDDDIPRGPGADEGDGRLERDRRGRRGRRPARRRNPHRPLLVALDLLRQRPGRDRGLRALAQVRAGIEGREDSSRLRHRRRGHRDRGPGRARLRDRHGSGEGLGLGPHARLRTARRRPPRLVRLDREPLGGAARAAPDLPACGRSGRPIS